MMLTLSSLDAAMSMLITYSLLKKDFIVNEAQLRGMLLIILTPEEFKAVLDSLAFWGL